jgi:hypothetical protein
MPVYFTQPIDGGPVKIGHARDVPARIKQLEAHYGVPLAVLATMDGGRKEERAIHERFSAHRFGRTEQFRPAADLMAFIGRPLLVSSNPDTVEAMESGWATIVVKGSPEWKAWVEAGARHCKMSVSACVAEAIKWYLRSQGFRKKKPRR